MKVFTLVILLMFSITTAFAQENKPAKEQTKKEKRNLRKQEDNEKLKKLHQLMNNQIWIIQIHSVAALEGNPVNVTPEENFIYVNKNASIVSLTLPQRIEFAGNSFDRILADGDISSYQLKEFRDNQEIDCLIWLVGHGGNQIKLDISIRSDGETTVIITLLSGVNFTFSGDIKFTDQTPVIEGF